MESVNEGLLHILITFCLPSVSLWQGKNCVCDSVCSAVTEDVGAEGEVGRVNM